MKVQEPGPNQITKYVWSALDALSAFVVKMRWARWVQAQRREIHWAPFSCACAHFAQRFLPTRKEPLQKTEYRLHFYTLISSNLWVRCSRTDYTKENSQSYLHWLISTSRAQGVNEQFNATRQPRVPSKTNSDPYTQNKGFQINLTERSLERN